MRTRTITQSRLQPPPALKGKSGVVELPYPAKLSLGETFITAQHRAEATLGAKVTTQAAAVKLTHDALVLKVAERKELEDAIIVKSGEVTTAIKSYDTALQDYAQGATKAADGDVIKLQTLGVTPVATTRTRRTGPPSAPEKIRLLPGPASGSVVIKHSRPAGAGSFAVQYKLEPSRPEDPWLAPETLQSKAPVQQLEGLAPGQLVRVRVRALGAGWGPYSEEVLGRAQ
jgi:hypothetical protein